MKEDVRILVVYERLPLPIRGGADRRVVEMLTFLSRTYSYTGFLVLEGGNSATRQFCSARGIDVSFVERPISIRRVANQLKRRIDWAASVMGIPSPIAVLRWLRRKWARPAAAGPSDPYWTQCDDVVKEKVARLCRDKRVNIVIVEYVWLAGCVAFLPDGLTRICDTHDVMHRRREAFIAATGKNLEHGLVDRETETRALSNFDAAIAIQEKERQLLEEMLPDSTVLCVGSEGRVDPPARSGAKALSWRDSRSRAILRALRSFKLLFLGGMHYGNMIALESFLSVNWPAIRSRVGVPGISLIIAGNVGKGMAGKWKWIEGVTWLGYVDDLLSVYSEVDAVINPVWFGSGLKIKTVEALKNGKLLVTTPIGVEGLPVGVEQACVLADSVEELTEAVVRVALGDVDVRAMAERADRYAREHLTLEGQYRELRSFIDALPAAGSAVVSHALSEGS